MKTHDHETQVKKVDRLSGTKVRLTVQLSAHIVKSHEQSTTQRYLNAAKIPGFRPGKAPIKMVEQKFRDEIRRDVLSHLVESGLLEALKQTKLYPVNEPTIQVRSQAFETEKPLEFEAEFEVQPEIELRDYKGIPLKKADLSVTEEELNQTLENLRERLAVLEPCSLIKPEKGNFAVAEIAVEVFGDKPKSEPMKSYTLELGSGGLLAELEAALLEMNTGESRKVKAKFPEDYNDKELAGKEAEFDCRLMDIKQKRLPDLDDAFASQLREGLSLDQLKNEIRENIASSKKEAHQSAQRQDILDYLILHNQFEVPASMVQRQAASLLHWIHEDLKKRGIAPTPLKEEESETVRKRAENMVRGSLLLREIASKEKIQLDESRLDHRLESLASQTNQNIEEMRAVLEGRGTLDQLRDEIVTDQVFSFLIENAQLV